MRGSSVHTINKTDSSPDAAVTQGNLEAIARLVLATLPPDDDDLRTTIQLGQSLMHDDDGDASTDMGFFLVAWATEQIARQRIEAGDLGIDDSERRVIELRGKTGWQQAVAEYRALADEIYIDALNELREFSMVMAFAGPRETFLRRYAAGRRHLARLLPGPITLDEMPLALAG